MVYLWNQAKETFQKHFCFKIMATVDVFSIKKSKQFSWTVSVAHMKCSIYATGICAGTF